MKHALTLRLMALALTLTLTAITAYPGQAQSGMANLISRERAAERDFIANENAADRQMISGMGKEPNVASETLQIGGKRTLSFESAIGRVDIDREGIVDVTSPTTTALSLVGKEQGNVTVTVFSREGRLLSETRFTILPETPYQSVLSDFPLAGQKVVAVDLQFAAVSTSTMKALGFNFARLAGGVQGAVVSPSSLSSFKFGGTRETAGPNGQPFLVNNGLSLETTTPLQGAFNLFLAGPKRGIGAVLSTLSTNGFSRILAQPTLLARSGEKATFLAGGEFPIPVPQGGNGAGNSVTIEYKEFGVRLSVTPYVLSKDNIVLKLSPEVSELDYGVGVQLQGYTVPGIRRRSAETTVELGSGQSFVIAGLTYDTSGVTKDKVPLLGDIPIIGALFKRQETTKEKQELVIVATPRIVDALSPDQVPALPGADLPDPTYGQMILGNDGVEKAVANFGIVRN